MATLNVTITDAGRAEVINAQNTGTGPVQITEMGFGTGQYTPSESATALSAETKRVSISGGAAVSDDTIHVVAQDASEDTYNVGEIGLYTDSGTLFALYSQTGDWIVQKGDAATLLISIDIILTTVDVDAVTFGDVVFVAPPATTTVPGIVQLNTSTNSTSTDQAATPSAVKSANDNANTRALASRDIAAGNGLTGGGNLTASRTISMGTPSSITDATSNSASGSTHTHAIALASTSQRGIVQLSTSTGSTSTSTAASSSAVKSANDNANTRALASRNIAAGNGLTGGGNLTANRTVSMGTPSTITDSTTNSASGSTHTHAINHASTGQRGIVQLSTSTGSTSTSTAATSSAVKAANDNANSRLTESQLKSSRSLVTLKSSGFVNGSNILSEDWDNFEELIVVTGSVSIANSVHSHHIFFTDVLVPDDTAPYNRNIITTSSATEIAFNVGSSNRRLMFFAGHGDDDQVVRVMGRFRK